MSGTRACAALHAGTPRVHQWQAHRGAEARIFSYVRRGGVSKFFAEFVTAARSSCVCLRIQLVEAARRAALLRGEHVSDFIVKEHYLQQICRT